MHAQKAFPILALLSIGAIAQLHNAQPAQRRSLTERAFCVVPAGTPPGQECPACYGTGSINCDADSCFNPGKGDSCCSNGGFCDVGYYCALDKNAATICCKNGEPCVDAVSTQSTVPGIGASTSAVSSSSSESEPTTTSTLTTTSTSTIQITATATSTLATTTSDDHGGRSSDDHGGHGTDDGGRGHDSTKAGDDHGAMSITASTSFSDGLPLRPAMSTDIMPVVPVTTPSTPEITTSTETSTDTASFSTGAINTGSASNTTFTAPLRPTSSSSIVVSPASSAAGGAGSTTSTTPSVAVQTTSAGMRNLAEWVGVVVVNAVLLMWI